MEGCDDGGKGSERLLAASLDAMGITAEDIPELRKNYPRKQASAWLLKSRTVVQGNW